MAEATEAAIQATVPLAPTCPQCGRLYSSPACGPTHAVVAAGTVRTRLVIEGELQVVRIVAHAARMELQRALYAANRRSARLRAQFEATTDKERRAAIRDRIERATEYAEQLDDAQLALSARREEVSDG